MSLTGLKNAAPITTPGRTRLLVGLTGTGRNLAESALQRFAERAYRRPLQPGEIQRIMALYDQATRDGAGSEEALQVAVTGVLVSPHFLFRAELDEQGEPNTAIGAHELASRLSYFLWGSFPDDALRRAAQDGSLLTDAGLTAQVDRMLKDPRAARLGTGFATPRHRLCRAVAAAPQALGTRSGPQRLPLVHAQPAHGNDRGDRAVL